MKAADDIEMQLRTLVASRLGAQEADVHCDASLINDLGADSLDMVGLIMAIEDDFDIDIPDEDAVQISTLRQLTEYVEFAEAARDSGRQSRQVPPRLQAAGSR